MKRALLVATVGGFVPQFEMNDVKLLRELGYDIHYAANFGNNVYDYDEATLAGYGVKKHNVDMAKSPVRIFKHIAAYKRLKAIIESEQIDLIHCHTPVGGALARLAASSSKRAVKVIYTAHGFHFYKGAPVLSSRIFYFIERYLARRTDAIVTINQEDYDNASRFRLRSGGRVYKISGVGINLDRFHGGTQRENTGGLHIVTVGELNKNKNHKVVIDAIKKLGRTDIYYTIYGQGTYEAYLRQYIESCGLGEYIELKGYTREPERVLLKADCFVFPSKREGLGMAALEAMACGLPVISGDNRGTREYMRNGYNGIICPANSSDEYAQAIERLAGSYKERADMGRNARTTAEGYDIRNTEEAMRQVYSSVM